MNDAPDLDLLISRNLFTRSETPRMYSKYSVVKIGS